jgi:catechol-2,3-dioxygenase
MGLKGRRQTARAAKPTVAGKKAAPKRKKRARKLIDDVTAILLISPHAERLCEFYRATLGLSLEEEVHDGIPPHFGCAIGDVHFAIHPAKGWPGTPTKEAQSPVISFSTSNLKAVAERLSASGVTFTGPMDHGFGQGISFRDPDGNFISILEYGPEYW